MPRTFEDDVKAEKAAISIEMIAMMADHVLPAGFQASNEMLVAMAQLLLESMRQTETTMKGASAMIVEAQSFVERVERGEIKSRKTYKAFKSLLLAFPRGQAQALMADVKKPGS